MAGAGRQTHGRSHPLRDRALYPLQGRAWRAGHHVFSRPVRQCPGVQGLRDARQPFRQIKIQGSLMNKTMALKAAALAAATLAIACAHAEPVDILKKIRETGTVTMGVREASGAMSYALGDG